MAVLLGMLLGPSVALAGPATDLVRTKQNVLFDLIARPETADQQAKVKALFDELLDYRFLAETSLPQHWAGLSEAQRAEFSSLLEQLVRNAYRKNLKKVLGYQIGYAGEQPDAGTAVLVKTRAQSKQNAREQPIEIDFKVDKVANRWLVRDIVTEGASLVRTYRRQFKSIMDQHGYPELVRRMRKKLDKGEG